MKHLLLLFLVFLCCYGCGNANENPETLIDSGYDEQEMDAAIARARREVDTFIAELSKPTGENHAVKVPISDNGETEHFWLINVSYRNGQFEGEIKNEPGMVRNVRLGEKRRVNKAEISDWMFIRGGKLYGNYTMRPLLKTMPKEEAEKYQSMIAHP
jgi:uncharacterized protein YegJ (DUF2314 family)